MKPRSRRKHKGRSESGTFTAIPHNIQDSANWRQASGTAIKLLCDIARQFNGRNNGDLCASLSVLKPKGWTSPETVTHAARELRHYGFITLTRQGGLYLGASLYALTWIPSTNAAGSSIVPQPLSHPANGNSPNRRSSGPRKIASPIRHP